MFQPNMTGDIGERGSCTTCTFTEDFSNYWTAVMFFRAENGSYKRVNIMENAALPNGIAGGMTVYYTQQDFNSNGNQKITSFKPVSGRCGMQCATYTGEMLTKRHRASA